MDYIFTEGMLLTPDCALIILWKKHFIQSITTTARGLTSRGSYQKVLQGLVYGTLIVYIF